MRNPIFMNIELPKGQNENKQIKQQPLNVRNEHILKNTDLNL